MVDAVALFFAMSTQWRWTSAGMAGTFRTGLEYASLDAVARANAINMTPAVFEDIRTLELEALSVWQGKK